MSRINMDRKDRQEQDKIADRFGVTRKPRPVWIRTSPKNIESMQRIGRFHCNKCGKPHVLLLPKGHDPCPQHTANYCCMCCMYSLMSTYCIGRDTTFVLEL